MATDCAYSGDIMQITGLPAGSAAPARMLFHRRPVCPHPKSEKGISACLQTDQRVSYLNCFYYTDINQVQRRKDK